MLYFKGMGVEKVNRILFYIHVYMNITVHVHICWCGFAGNFAIVKNDVHVH